MLETLGYYRRDRCVYRVCPRKRVLCHMVKLCCCGDSGSHSSEGQHMLLVPAGFIRLHDILLISEVNS